MAGGVDGNVGWSNDLQLVRVQRAGGRGADIHFFIRDIERAFAIDRGPWQGIDARDVSMRAPSHELSTRPAHSAADDPPIVNNSASVPAQTALFVFIRILQK